MRVLGQPCDRCGGYHEAPRSSLDGYEFCAWCDLVANVGDRGELFLHTLQLDWEEWYYHKLFRATLCPGNT